MVDVGRFLAPSARLRAYIYHQVEASIGGIGGQDDFAMLVIIGNAKATDTAAPSGVRRART